MSLFINKLKIVIVYLICIQIISCSKLNVPRVLLPVFNHILPNFTLEVSEGGCYKWTVSRLDIVMLTPLDVDPISGCSSRCLITGISREPTRNTAIVLVEDVDTKQVLRCDVVLDVISSLGIVTTTRELLVEEAPEAFEVAAYDSQGNHFTTLEGVEFSWVITTPSDGDSVNEGAPTSLTVVQVLPFRNSIYKTPASVQCFDGSGKYGHIALLEGANTGSAMVQIHLPQPEYAHVPPLEVALHVVANLIISPSDVYIMAGDSVPFQVSQVRKGRVHPVLLSGLDTQYYLSIDDKEVATIDGNVLTGFKNGNSIVHVKDRLASAKDSSDAKLPQASIHVVVPAKLALSIMPHNNWVVLVGNEYQLYGELFTSNENKICLGEGVDMLISVESSLFESVNRTANGTAVWGHPLVTGTTPVQAELRGVTTRDRRRLHTAKLQATAEMLVYERIELHPAEVVLPWDPTMKPKHEVSVQATGGDGYFTWSTNKPLLSAVSNNGLVTTLGSGHSVIRAAMSRNGHNSAVSNFYVIPPVALEIIDYVLEAPVGSIIPLYVALYGNKVKGSSLKMPFTSCDMLTFNVKIHENNFERSEKEHNISNVGVSCTNIVLEATAVGISQVTISYASENTILQDTVTISAFRPLQVFNPENGVTVLSVGSSRNIIFTGGPKPHHTRPSDHKYRVTPSEPRSVDVTEITEVRDNEKAQVYAFTVLCREAGESTITFSVGNIPDLPNCHHTPSEVKVTVICALPRTIHLIPSVPMPDPSSCPMDLHGEVVVQQNYKDVSLFVEVNDNLGRKFDNFSSLQLDWTLTPCNLSTCEKLRPIESVVRYEYGVEIPDGYVQVIPTSGINGILKVAVNAKSYIKKLLKTLKIIPEWPEFGILNDKGVMETPVIKDNIKLFLVGDSIIEQNNITLFNHPSNIANIPILQGSGYYEVHLTSDDVAKVTYGDAQRNLQIEPLNNGYLRIDLVDICLPAPAVSIYVNVVSVRRIMVKMPDRVEKGQCIEAIVRLLDEHDALMPVPSENLLDFRYSIDTDAVSVRQAPRNTDWGVGELHYLVTGIELGDATLQFSSGKESREVQSPFMAVQVFSPLRLYPRNITLIIGSGVEIQVRGGPHLDIAVDFELDEASVASIAQGIVTGLSVGHSRITGRAEGLNPATDTMVTYSQDTIDVYVIPLLGIKIHSPLVQFQAGTMLPVWITGHPDQLNPLILGSREPALKVEWEVVGADVSVVTIRNVFHNAGVEYRREDQIVIRVLANKPGRVQLRAHVDIPPGVGIYNTNHLVTSMVDLEVFEPLRLINPDIPLSFILMAPNSKLNLRSNAAVNYYVEGAGQEGDFFAAPVVTVSQSGLLEASSFSGSAMVRMSTKDDNGVQQSIGIPVEVRPVHYMMVDLTQRLKTTKISHKLPRGLTMDMAVTYHDNTGRRFTSSISDVGVGSSRSDLAAVTLGAMNTTLRFTLALAGNTMLKIFEHESSRHLTDYVKLAVSDVSATGTANVFTVGDYICFSLTMSTDGGIWSSSDHNTLTIDPKTGLGRALMESSDPITISLMLNEAIVYKVEVTIEPIRYIGIIPLGDRALVNTGIGKTFKVYFVLRHKQDQPDSNLVCQAGHPLHIVPVTVSRPDLFTCDLTIRNSLYASILKDLTVQGSFNPEKGFYSCDIVTVEPFSWSQQEAEIFLTITALGSEISETVLVPILSPIQVVPLEVILKYDGSGILNINGPVKVLEQLQVSASDATVLSVAEPERSSDQQLRYHLQLLDYEYGERVPHVVVKSELSDQLIKVPVLQQSSNYGPCKSSSLGISPFADTIYHNSLLLAVLVTFICLIIGGVYMYANHMRTINAGRQTVLNTTPTGIFNRCQPRSPYTNSSKREGYYNADTTAHLSDMSGSVYGDPTLMTSPEARRHRRLL